MKAQSLANYILKKEDASDYDEPRPVLATDSMKNFQEPRVCTREGSAEAITCPLMELRCNITFGHSQ